MKTHKLNAKHVKGIHITIHMKTHPSLFIIISMRLNAPAERTHNPVMNVLFYQSICSHWMHMTLFVWGNGNEFPFYPLEKEVSMPLFYAWIENN